MCNWAVGRLPARCCSNNVLLFGTSHATAKLAGSGNGDRRRQVRNDQHAASPGGAMCPALCACSALSVHSDLACRCMKSLGVAQGAAQRGRDRVGDRTTRQTVRALHAGKSLDCLFRPICTRACMWPTILLPRLECSCSHMQEILAVLVCGKVVDLSHEDEAQPRYLRSQERV